MADGSFLSGRNPQQKEAAGPILGLPSQLVSRVVAVCCFCSPWEELKEQVF